MTQQIIVRTYNSEREYQRDAQYLARQGWRVTNVTRDNRNSGCVRGCLLGLMALVFKPSAKWVVTYQRV